jgi:hypothetical protein
MTTQHQAALEAAYATRATARARLVAAAAALDRGRRIERDAQADLKKAQAVELETEAAHASRLHASIVAGAEDLPADMAPPNFSDAPPNGTWPADKRTTEMRLSIAGRAVEALAGQHAEALAAAQLAERNVAAAVDAVLHADLLAAADEFLELRNRMLEQGDAVRALIPDALTTPGGYVAIPPSAQTVIDFLNVLRDDLHVPSNKLRGFPEFGAERERRRAALIAGGNDNATNNSAAAA